MIRQEKTGPGEDTWFSGRQRRTRLRVSPPPSPRAAVSTSVPAQELPSHVRREVEAGEASEEAPLPPGGGPGRRMAPTRPHARQCGGRQGSRKCPKSRPVREGEVPVPPALGPCAGTQLRPGGPPRPAEARRGRSTPKPRRPPLPGEAEGTGHDEIKGSGSALRAPPPQ